MSYPTKLVPLSRQALIQEHGRLLQDSGFTKLDSTPDSFEDSVHISMGRRAGWSYHYGTVTGRLCSGRPETPSIPRTEAQSTSALASLGTGSTQSTEELRESILRGLNAALVGRVPERVPLFLPKTSYQRLKSECREAGMDMPSWVRPLARTRFLFCSGRQYGRSTFGLILMQLARMQGVPLPSSFVSWASILSQSPQTETPSATASGKSGVL